MVFVVLAYEDLKNHSAGFVCLQIALLLVVIQNTLYVLDTEVAYKFVGGLRNTQILAKLYLICNIIISPLKIGVSVNFCINGIMPGWVFNKTAIPGYTVGRVIDSIWMVFNAVVPLLISLIRARTEKPLIVTIDMLGPNFMSVDTSNSSEGNNMIALDFVESTQIDLAKNGGKFFEDDVAA